MNINIANFLFIFSVIFFTNTYAAQFVNHPKDSIIGKSVIIPDLIPQKREGKIGYVNRSGKVIIKPEFNFATFFYEDCNLLQSPDPKLRKFGTNQYASVTIGEKDYRIDKKGKKVYTFHNNDLGKCTPIPVEQIYRPYTKQGFFGIVNVQTFHNADDYKQFQIYPQYQYLFVLIGDDPNNPAIIATKDDKFGVIDIYNNIIIPFEYSDIKRNFSWKMAKMFEVTKDGKNYYYIDVHNKGY